MFIVRKSLLFRLVHVAYIDMCDTVRIQMVRFMSATHFSLLFCCCADKNI